jgi:site-specific DNA-methyltransferase (adenine-specific)
LKVGRFETGRVYQGDCLRLLQELPDDSVDSLVTDPPYCSGGDVEADPNEKYVQGGMKLQRPTFAGDNRSPHAFRYWCALWMSEAFRACKRGAYAIVFSDARMLPEACDVFEAGGFIRRGIIPWDKTEKSRAPHSGYFKLQAEFAIWGSKGDLPKHSFGPFPGAYRVPVRLDDKFHTTGKPTFLMQQLLKPIQKNAIVLDPFAGSGSTGVAAKLEGLQFIGFEATEEYTKIANERLA